MLPRARQSNDWANALVRSDSGEYVLAGSTTSSGAGSYDAWLIKTEASSNIPEFPLAVTFIAIFLAIMMSVILIARKILFHKKARQRPAHAS
jgi:hypothetical protein